MDIICAKCGKHFSSIESAREHRGKCKHSSQNKDLHWIPPKKNDLNEAEWDNLVELINPENNSESVSQPLRSASNYNSLPPQKPPRKNCKIDFKKYKKWVLTLATIFILTIVGIVIYELTANVIPAILLFTFSVIFPIDKWFTYYTKKHKKIGMLYRLILNLAVLSLLGLLIYLTVNLFTSGISAQPIFASLLILGTLVLFIWLWKIVFKNRWRWPSMKLTVASLIIIFLVASFAGVEPLHTYKNDAINYAKVTIKEINEYFKTNDQKTNTSPIQKTTFAPVSQQITSTVKTSITTTATVTITSTTPTITLTTQIPTEAAGINSKTGAYGDFYLGLVKGPDGVIGGNKCYGKFIVLINNKKATNPTYAELLNFLKSDNTDSFPYLYTIKVLLPYYGTAESHIDLARLQGIIDGTEQPLDPRVCADFAERLHNNAEKAGIRCGYVCIELSIGEGHAINVFETIDKGLIYIDCTGFTDGIGPIYQDTIVDTLEAGNEYNPRFLFPSGGWYIPSGEMGVITEIYQTWDGNWN